MQKPIMAVTGDETGKNFRERFKFCKIIFEVLKNYLRTSEYFKSIAFLRSFISIQYIGILV